MNTNNATRTPEQCLIIAENKVYQAALRSKCREASFLIDHTRIHIQCKFSENAHRWLITYWESNGFPEFKRTSRISCKAAEAAIAKALPGLAK